MAKAAKSKKKPIDQYDHKGKKRVNNPPVGLVTPETDRETGKKKYAYDPHIDPALQFDSQRSQVEKIIDKIQGQVCRFLISRRCQLLIRETRLGRASPGYDAYQRCDRIGDPAERCSQ